MRCDEGDGGGGGGKVMISGEREGERVGGMGKKGWWVLLRVSFDWQSSQTALHTPINMRMSTSPFLPVVPW